MRLGVAAAGEAELWRTSLKGIGGLGDVRVGRRFGPACVSWCCTELFFLHLP